MEPLDFSFVKNAAVRAFQSVEYLVSGLAAVAMFAVMIIATADVGMRYVFNSPFIWSQELIRLYLAPIIVYFTLSFAYRQHAHISVDILQYRISGRARHACAFVTALVVVFLFSMVAVGSFERALDEWRSDDVLAGIIAWRVWPASAIVTVGSTLMVIRGLAHAIQHARSLLAQEDHIELAPLAIYDDTSVRTEN